MSAQYEQEIRRILGDYKLGDRARVFLPVHTNGSVFGTIQHEGTHRLLFESTTIGCAQITLEHVLSSKSSLGEKERQRLEAARRSFFQSTHALQEGTATYVQYKSIQFKQSVDAAVNVVSKKPASYREPFSRIQGVLDDPSLRLLDKENVAIVLAQACLNTSILFEWRNIDALFKGQLRYRAGDITFDPGLRFSKLLETLSHPNMLRSFNDWIKETLTPAARALLREDLFLEGEFRLDEGATKEFVSLIPHAEFAADPVGAIRKNLNPRDDAVFEWVHAHVFPVVGEGHASRCGEEEVQILKEWDATFADYGIPSLWANSVHRPDSAGRNLTDITFVTTPDVNTRLSVVQECVSREQVVQIAGALREENGMLYVHIGGPQFYNDSLPALNPGELIVLMNGIKIDFDVNQYVVNTPVAVPIKEGDLDSIEAASPPGSVVWSLELSELSESRISIPSSRLCFSPMPRNSIEIVEEMLKEVGSAGFTFTLRFEENGYDGMFIGFGLDSLWFFAVVPETTFIRAVGFMHSEANMPRVLEAEDIEPIKPQLIALMRHYTLFGW